ncbi:hypothetical protein KQI42_19930 [Tissierella sp. MSJ-40]|uniref:Histidine kinase n=1 Tax=Tissierella simiarum TaxID=2841534 RepID=A0ABS6EBG0_9FIRM|nr:hypothetical protein [Tissierella simiarum]MBU5440267.1 hypothetical protein [Tissierella simiarum]
MQGEKLLTKEDLAERWQVHITTIDRWMKDKIITPVKGIPSVRFNPQHIAKLEGVELSKLSPLERKRLEREKGELEQRIKELEIENQELKDYVRVVFQHGARFLNIGKEA